MSRHDLHATVKMTFICACEYMMGNSFQTVYILKQATPWTSHHQYLARDLKQATPWTSHHQYFALDLKQAAPWTSHHQYLALDLKQAAPWTSHHQYLARDLKQATPWTRHHQYFARDLKQLQRELVISTLRGISARILNALRLLLPHWYCSPLSAVRAEATLLCMCGYAGNKNVCMYVCMCVCVCVCVCIYIYIYTQAKLCICR